ncbi:tRNA 2-selenouridine(34) synthase MnmH [uncultured Jannaschia sp.]|uniref:tRNA 2-selenouridine(34) synthase MnmH n=1 Tax=uncultured Jannaschia sp. TaxID=293347 RepID=UPI0026304971|nr:tRNA 2-selenouridine(34) synthase MnmH [uncultured Jannaschia sp.]
MSWTLTQLMPDGPPFDEVIDVRAPQEFAEDHMPGAVNLPVLSDAERARIGTIYVQQDRFLARKIGAALVARNAAAHLEGPLADRGGGWRPLLYCWRGGQRSNSFASILAQIGWRVEVLDGGYRSYRRLVSQRLYETPLGLRLVVVDGGTGSGKTELLHRIAAEGGQVVDLEGLARHRGSNFGAMPGGQPAQKMFESRLVRELDWLDPTRPVFVEAESNAIGHVRLPPSLWTAMGRAETIRLDASPEARGRFLTTTYPDLTADADLLARRIETLRPYHSREQIAAWHAMAREGRHAEMARDLIERHYDRRYRDNSSHRTDIGRIDLGALSEADLRRAAARALEIAELAPVA